MLKRGFTLVEAFIAIVVLSILVFSILNLITNMGSLVRKDFEIYCLVQAALSGLEAKRANPEITVINLTCGGRNIQVSLREGSRISTSCYEVESVAQSGTRSITLKGAVCNFGG